MGKVMGATAVYNQQVQYPGGYDDNYDNPSNNYYQNSANGNYNPNPENSSYSQPSTVNDSTQSGNFIINAIKNNKKKSGCLGLSIVSYIIYHANKDPEITIIINGKKLSPEETKIHLQKEKEAQEQMKKIIKKSKLKREFGDDVGMSQKPINPVNLNPTDDEPDTSAPSPIIPPQNPKNPIQQPPQQPAPPVQAPPVQKPQPKPVQKPSTPLDIYKSQLGKELHPLLNEINKHYKNYPNQWSNFDDDLKVFINDYLSNNPDHNKVLNNLTPLDKFCITSNEIAIDFFDQKILKAIKICYTNNTVTIDDENTYDTQEKIDQLKIQFNEIINGIQAFVKSLNDLNSDFKDIFSSPLMNEATYVNKMKELFKLENKNNPFFSNLLEDVYKFANNEFSIMDKYTYYSSLKPSYGSIFSYGSRFSYEIDYPFIKQMSERIKSHITQYNSDKTISNIIKKIDVEIKKNTDLEEEILKPIKDFIVKDETMVMFQDNQTTKKTIEEINKKLVSLSKDCCIEYNILGLLTLKKNNQNLIEFNLNHYMYKCNNQIKNKELRSELLLYYDKDSTELITILETIKTIVLGIHEENKKMYEQDKKDIEKMHTDIKDLIDSIPLIDDYSMIYPYHYSQGIRFDRDEFIIETQHHTIRYKKNNSTMLNTLFELKKLYDYNYQKYKEQNKTDFEKIKQNIETGINKINHKVKEINDFIDQIKTDFKHQEIYKILTDPSINIKDIFIGSNSLNIAIDIKKDNIEIFNKAYLDNKIVLYANPEKNQFITESIQKLSNNKQLFDEMKRSFNLIQTDIQNYVKKYQNKALTIKFPKNLYNFFTEKQIGKQSGNNLKLRLFLENNEINTSIKIGQDFIIDMEKIPSILGIKYLKFNISNTKEKIFSILLYGNSLYYDFNGIDEQPDFDTNMKPQLLESINKFLEYITDKSVKKKA